MNQQVATVEKPTRLEQFRAEILPPERKRDLFASLPAHVRPEVFERNLVNALMQNPNLMAYEARLVFREVSKAAALGLYLDPQLGEAYLIEAYNGKTKQKEPQLRIGYRGLVKLGRQSGEIKMIYAHEVHQADSFHCSLGDHKSLVHEPDIFGVRGPIVGYYAVVKYADGETDFEPMTVDQVHGIRDRSDGWKAYKAEKIRSTPWSTDEVEMSKKTVIRRLVKRIPQSPELAEAIKIEDAAEHSDMRAISSAAPVARLTPPPAPPPVEEATVIEEIEDGVRQPPDIPAELDRTQPKKSHTKTKAAPKVVETVDPQTGEITETTVKPLAFPGTEDPEAFLKWVEAMCTAVNESDPPDALQDMWNDKIAPHLDGLFPPDAEEAHAVYDRHERRLAPA